MLNLINKYYDTSKTRIFILTCSVKPVMLIREKFYGMSTVC